MVSAGPDSQGLPALVNAIVLVQTALSQITLEVR